jgi:hypothetical protein
MNTPALRLVRLRFSARMLGEAVMPEHKSSLFHGVFGRVLHRDFPYLYSELFGNERDDGDASPIIHPYILLAPPDELRTWNVGHEFAFELTLFGKAVRHAQACCDALRLVGRDGLGEGRAKFIVHCVDHLTADGLVNIWRDGLDTAWITPVDLCLEETGVACAGVTLDLQTPLRLKHENKLVRQPPDFSLLFSKLLARLNMLSQAQGNQPLVEGETKARLLQLADDIVLNRSDTRWVDWNRYSSSQKASMQFGGLMGTLEYGGELAPFLPLLRMAELTHLGGKTTFGLGKVVCRV